MLLLIFRCQLLATKDKQQDHQYHLISISVIGIGEKNCIKIPVDKQGKMIPSELGTTFSTVLMFFIEKAIVECKKRGKVPFFINATAGTTVLGAYDPLDAIADIAAKYGIWAHCDACWGGHALFTTKHKHLMKGIEKVGKL